MASPGGTGSPSPNRLVAYEISGPQWRRNRSHTQIFRVADQIRLTDRRDGKSPAVPQTGLSRNVMRVPGGAWILRPLNVETVAATTDAFPGADIGTLLLPPNYTSVKVGKPPDLLGMGASGLLSTFPPAIRKRVPHVGGAEGDWGTPSNNTLAPDQSAFPSPALTLNTIPHDRVALTTTTLGENNAFVFTFRVPEDFFGSDALFRIFFGGQADTDPSSEEDPRTEGAGNFCLSIRGGGQALLYEQDAASDSGWDYRHSYQWLSGPLAPDVYYSIALLPYGKDRVLLGTMLGPGGGPGFTVIDLLASAALVGIQLETGTPFSLYVCDRPTSGHTHVLVATGAGPVRIDARRDLRTPFGIYRYQFPEDGLLTDDLFTIPEMPAGTPMKLTTDAHTEALGSDGSGGAITAVLFNADTLTALSVDGDGNWLTEEGASAYYVQFTLEPPTDRYSTPALYSYTIDIEAVSTFSELPWIPCTRLRRASITGPDSFAPDHETCSVSLKDLTDSAALLRTRGRIHARVRVTDRQGKHLVTLFEGETMRPAGPRARKRGKKFPTGYSRPNWYDYDNIPHNGMWIRVADQWMTGERDPINFALDDTAEEDSKTHKKPPWKITDAIRFLLKLAGVDFTQQDIPDLDQRFIPTPKTRADDLMILPGTALHQTIQHFVRDFLGYTLFFEPNAGPAGMWRLIPPARASTDKIRVEFHRFDDTHGGAKSGLRVTTALRAMENVATSGDAAQTYIFDGSFYEWIEPPEFNYIRVVGGTPADPGTVPKQRLEREWNNPLSYDLDAANRTSDPSDITFLDAGKVPLVVIDPNLNTQEMVDWILIRLVLFAGSGRHWVSWQSPLVFFEDPGATDGEGNPIFVDGEGNPTQRPLRPQDLIMVHMPNGDVRTAVVANCNPDIKSVIQRMDVEALLLPQGI